MIGKDSNLGGNSKSFWAGTKSLGVSRRRPRDSCDRVRERREERKRANRSSVLLVALSVAGEDEAPPTEDGLGELLHPSQGLLVDLLAGLPVRHGVLEVLLRAPEESDGLAELLGRLIGEGHVEAVEGLVAEALGAVDLGLLELLGGDELEGLIHVLDEELEETGDLVG